MREQNQESILGGQSEKSISDDVIDEGCGDLLRSRSVGGSDCGNDSTLGELDESYSDVIDFEDDDESLMSYSPGSSTLSGGGGTNGGAGDEEDEDIPGDM